MVKICFYDNIQEIEVMPESYIDFIEIINILFEIKEFDKLTLEYTHDNINYALLKSETYNNLFLCQENKSIVYIYCSYKESKFFKINEEKNNKKEKFKNKLNLNTEIMDNKENNDNYQKKENPEITKDMIIASIVNQVKKNMQKSRFLLEKKEKEDRKEGEENKKEELLIKNKCFNISSEIQINLKSIYNKNNIYDESKNIKFNKDKIIDNNKIKNEKITQSNDNFKNEINELKIKLREEKLLNEKLDKKLKELEKIIKDKDILLNKEKNLTKNLNEKINQLKNNSNDNNSIEKRLELMEKLEKKENEIKEIKSRYPFELLEGEKIMSVIFISVDQKIHYSIICKNTDKFSKIENLLYEKYPEYLESENFFLVNGNKVNRFKKLEENGIHNSDIITLNPLVE